MENNQFPAIAFLKDIRTRFNGSTTFVRQLHHIANPYLLDTIIKIANMQTAIGIRANPTQITYCVLTGSADQFEIKLIDKIVNPKSLNVPEQLKFIRSTLCDIINENNVNVACIRITESNAKQISVPRIYMEGVIQELIASSTVKKYYIGQISNISSKLGIDRTDFKLYASGEKVFLEIEKWENLSLEERESLMASASALN